jgi:hypothetical protein
LLPNLNQKKTEQNGFSVKQKDLRIKERPITKHPDFEMYLHNNTQPTLKYFQKDKYD